MSELMESNRFKRTINPYKEKKFIVSKTVSTSEKLQGLSGKMSSGVKKTASSFKGVQDKLREHLPGLIDYDKKKKW
jgi:hypothetical protein